MRQVGEWLEMYHREPWGHDAADTRNALLAMVTMQAAGAKNVKIDQYRLRTPAAAEELAPKEFELARKVRGFFKLPVPKSYAAPKEW